MAELRSAEGKLNVIAESYEKLLRNDELKEKLPMLQPTTKTKTTNPTTNTAAAPPLTFTELLQDLQEIQNELESLRPNMERFQKRLAEKDPVTAKPRYGETTQARVTALLSRYNELEQIMAALFGAETDNHVSMEEQGKDPNNDSSRQLMELIQRKVDQETKEADHKAKQAEIEEQARVEQLEREKREQAEREQRERDEQEERERQAAEARRQQQREEREAQQRAQQEARRADREWVQSVTKGPEGVKQQLGVLLEATKDDLVSQRVAVQALHVIFGQICSRPEEPNFRRIRRDHPKFNEDIGRHDGGKEILIAAGFVLGEIDGVPVFLSKEPNLETDMDKWSEWFDLLKATLAVLDEQVNKL